MKIDSFERSTGHGGIQYTAVPFEGRWLRVSGLAQAKFHGKEKGESHYSVELSINQHVASFYRSNHGNEEVIVYRLTKEGQYPIAALKSFEEADDWAAG